MAQIHYVVVYDTETEKWSIDDDTTVAKFNYANCWIEESEEWVSPEDDLYDAETEGIMKLWRLLDNQ